MRSQSLQLYDSDPGNQSHSRLVMSVLGAVTEHWALNKVRSACYRVVQVATDI